MTREELSALIRLLYDSGRITAAQAIEIMQLFDAGLLNAAGLPLPLRVMPGPVTTRELAEAIARVAAQLPPVPAQALRNAATRPVTTGTPPEVKTFLRNRLASHFRADYERTVRRYTEALANGGDVAAWHQAMIREQRAYIARMTVAGLGRPLAVEEMDRVSRLTIQQQNYLFRFSGEISARRAAGVPFSDKYLQARAGQYQGVGWQAFWEGMDSAETLGQDGHIVHYQARDDDRTCGPCLDAQNNGPYLAGSGYPRPGQVCRGHGLCRCTLRFEYDLQQWQRLSQRRAA